MDTDNQPTQTESSAERAPQNGSAPAQDASAPQQTREDAQAELVQTDDVKKIIETLLFITDRPVKASRLADVVETVNAKQVTEIIAELTQEYAERGSAVQIVEIAGGYQMSTKPEYGRWVRRLYNEKMTTKLSNAALETLAIVAYKQPLTRAEMEAIRGVDVAGPLERLLERGLVRVVGKKDTVGRPMVYGTTDEFLRMFGLNKISELPDLQVFAAKNLHEKQADLPFGDPLPPVGEPGIIALEDLDEAEKLEALGTPVDSFFTRNTYNRGELFVKDLADGNSAAGVPDEAESEETTPSEPAETDAAKAAGETQTASADRDAQETAALTDNTEGSFVPASEEPSVKADESAPEKPQEDPAREAFLKQFGAASDLPAWVRETSSEPAVSGGERFASQELKDLETGLDVVLAQEAQEHLVNQAAGLQAELEKKAEEAHTPSAKRQESTEEK